ncbi:MAG: Fe-S protein assembly co-chaperone HscB [Acidobacteria bacterium]|nr:Fe-S protein assembly co-chaperone HscB [Acidobacteriota bacterium]MBI3663986.1 Fe-S protein assembly co-chaperone HscB [Acidobacteriota bacterium]
MTTVPIATEAFCWSCHAPHVGGHFCAACGKIQPLPRGADYFAFFGLPQKLWIDCAQLEQLFHQLSWKLHPDNFVCASEYERELSLERSSQLNDAYRALRDPIARVEYLLASGGMREEGAARQQAPPELLEEVFELNESLDDLRTARSRSLGTDGGKTAALKQRLEAEEKKFEAKLGEVDEELKRIAGEWDAALDAGADEAKRKALMARMNDVLNRRRYIRNLVANVQKELAEA